MTLTEKLKQVKEYIDRAPFTREEIEAAWAYFDEDYYFRPSNIFALAVAMDFARDKGDKKLQDELYEKYQKALSKTIKILAPQKTKKNPVSNEEPF